MKGGKAIFLFLMGLTGSITWGCGSDDIYSGPGDSSSSSKLEFENASAGYSGGELTLTNLKEVSVYGSVSGASSLLFDDVTLTLTDGKWNYPGSKYWEPEKDYRFYGIAPAGSDAWNVTIENAGTPYEKCLLGFNVPKSAGKVDLIAAVPDVITTPKELPANMAPVKFNFRHLLSQVRFTFINELVNPYYVINVDYGVILDPLTVGTITVSDEGAQWQVDSWYDTHIGFSRGQAYVDIPYRTDPIFVLPGERGEVNVTFQTQLFYCPGGNLDQFKELTYSCFHSVKLPPINYEMGKSYNFIAHLTPANVLGNDGDELSGITFDVEEQWRWDAETNVWE